MGFPDRIERTMDLEHPIERVWEALTTAEGLAGWFGTTAEIDLRPGGKGDLYFADHDLHGPFEVRVIEPPTRFAFNWHVPGLPDDDPRRTFVEFTLEKTASGTRLILVESGFAQMPEGMFEANTRGWPIKLAELGQYLDAA